MELTVGAILEGKVKSITNFGAFIALGDNQTGMVHISEVANSYVSDIRQHLTEGQDVKVMVIGVDGNKVNLSIKRLEARPQRPTGNNFRSGAPVRTVRIPARTVHPVLPVPRPRLPRLPRRQTSFLKKS